MAKKETTEYFLKEANALAKDALDRELSLHPEMWTYKDKIFEQKLRVARVSIEKKHEEFISDLSWARDYIQDLDDAPEKENALRLVNQVIEDYREDRVPLEGTHLYQKELPVTVPILKYLKGVAGDLIKADISQGKKMYQLLCTIHNGIYDHWIGLGFAYLSEGEIDEARKAFSIARYIVPEEPKVIYYQLLLALTEKDHASAQKCYEEGIKYSTPSSEWEAAFQKLEKDFEGLT